VETRGVAAGPVLWVPGRSLCDAGNGVRPGERHLSSEPPPGASAVRHILRRGARAGDTSYIDEYYMATLLT
jgi:hypothetical protein